MLQMSCVTVQSDLKKRCPSDMTTSQTVQPLTCVGYKAKSSDHASEPFTRLLLLLSCVSSSPRCFIPSFSAVVKHTAPKAKIDSGLGVSRHVSATSTRMCTPSHTRADAYAYLAAVSVRASGCWPVASCSSFDGSERVHI